MNDHGAKRFPSTIHFRASGEAGAMERKVARNSQRSGKKFAVKASQDIIKDCVVQP